MDVVDSGALAGPYKQTILGGLNTLPDLYGLVEGNFKESLKV